MNMKSLKTQFIGAIAMVLVAAIAMGSSTYAWFSMNSKVTVTGMNVKTEVKDNLLIAPAADLTDTEVAEAEFTTSRIDNISATLQPTSTVNGLAYFYTDKSNVFGNGDHINDVFTAYNGSTGVAATSTQLDSFRTNAGYETTATDVFGFVDYVFFLKAQNTSGTDAPVTITDLNLVYGKPSIAEVPEKAFRVAILSERQDAVTGFAGTPGTLVSILTVDAANSAKARYFDSAAGNGVASTTTLSPVSQLGTAAVIGSVQAGKTQYFKVVVRLWLEGEDVTCNNNTYAKFDDKWALDMTIELAPTSGANKNGVTQINATYTASKIIISGTVATTAEKTIDGVSFYKIGDTSYYTTSNTSLSASSRIFEFVNEHPIEITEKCTIS